MSSSSGSCEVSVIFVDSFIFYVAAIVRGVRGQSNTSACANSLPAWSLADSWGARP